VYEDARIGKKEKNGEWKCKLPLDYWQDLVNSRGKTLVSQEEKRIAETVVRQFQASCVTLDYAFTANQSHIEFFFDQCPIYTEENGHSFKGLVDRIIFYPGDSNNAPYIIPIDIKTMSGPTSTFRSKARKFRYDIQGTHYRDMLKKIVARIDPSIEVKPFLFVVNSATHPYEPMTYALSQTDEDIARYGCKISTGDYLVMNSKTQERNWFAREHREIHGIQEALIRLLWYQDNGFEKSYDYIKTKGHERLNLFFS
jgi:hypothetical protein